MNELDEYVATAIDPDAETLALKGSAEEEQFD
jgi:hypothetical protein